MAVSHRCYDDNACSGQLVKCTNLTVTSPVLSWKLETMCSLCLNFLAFRRDLKSDATP